MENDIQAILDTYKGLFFCKKKNTLEGELCISQNDCYDIIIDITPFPTSFPKVFEVGERIPSKLSRHKFNNSEQCCLTTDAKAAILLKTKIKTLSDFMSLIIVPYFENNSYFEINRRYKFGEFSHDIDGIIEGYVEILGIQKIERIIDTLMQRVRGRKVRPNDKCYCGNGMKLKNCHSKKYKLFRLVSTDIIKRDLSYFFAKLKASKPSI